MFTTHISLIIAAVISLTDFSSVFLQLNSSFSPLTRLNILELRNWPTSKSDDVQVGKKVLMKVAITYIFYVYYSS